MNSNALELLDPDALSRVHRLGLVARGVVEGFVSGHHRSPYKGFSVEFAEHREYAPGDDLRNLDWRVLGKSDRYYVRQYIEETNLRCTILLDASGSMAYTGALAAPHRGRRLSKFEYGRMLAVCLAHMLIGQQDAVGIVTFDTAVRSYLPARARASYLRAMLETLAGTAPGGETALGPILHDIAERVHRRGMVILISDLFDDPVAVLNALHHFRFRKHELIVMHVMAGEELTFPFESWSEFRDLEHNGMKIDLEPKSVRAAYLDEMRAFVDAIEKGCGRISADYVPISTQRPFDDALSAYLSHRQVFGR